MLNDYQSKTYVEREAKQLIKIEKEGSISNPKTFNNKFNDLQLDLITLLKSDSRCCTDYGYLYLRYLEAMGIIQLNFMPDKIISPETINRLRRRLFEMARYGNKELNFLLKYDDKDNDNLNNDSKSYYRYN